MAVRADIGWPLIPKDEPFSETVTVTLALEGLWDGNWTSRDDEQSVTVRITSHSPRQLIREIEAQVEQQIKDAWFSDTHFMSLCESDENE